MSKDGTQRENIVSRFGKGGYLMSIDYDSYHIRLIAELVGYKEFTDGRVYDTLAKYYYSTESPTTEEIEASKRTTFKILYGGVTQEYMEIPFFNLVSQFSQKLFNSAEKNTEEYLVKSALYAVPIRIPAENISPAKVLNYYLQSLETEQNVRMLVNLKKYITDHLLDQKIVPILYTYDSVLFDVLGKIPKNHMQDIYDIMSHSDKFPLKIEVGLDYKNMSKI
jgi:hypothetical protein